MGLLSNQMIAGAAGAAGGGSTIYDYQIANSCRFNQSATAHMYHTQGTPTNVDKCTISAWVKRGKMGNADSMFTGSGIYGYDYSWFGFNTANEFYAFQDPNGPRLESNALFRDTSAWYHIVIANDTTQGTAANRNKIYINGVQYTDWGDYEIYSTQNQDMMINSSGRKIFVGSGGASEGNSWLPFDGYIAEYVFIDGTQYAATDFGETKNGVWIPKDPSGLTFGNNGCYLKFESSGDLGNDSSGNNNDFTISNVSPHDQMTDSPSFNSDSNGGNMCTWNPLDAKNMATPTEGNLSVDFSGTNYNQIRGTMSIGNSGKWYMELYKSGTYATYPAWGICDQSQILTSSYTTPGYLAKAMAGIAWDFNASKVYKSLTYSESSSGTEIGATANVYTNTAQIVGMAIDLDNNKIFTHVNGTWDSGCGDPSSGGSGFDASGLSGVNNLVPVMLPSSYNSPNYVLVGGFGADSTFAGLTSAGSGTDVNGYGNFKYTVPTNYKAICQGNQSVANEVDPAQTEDNFPQKLFSPKIWTGDGNSGRSITIDMAKKPSLSIIRQRNSGNNWNVWTQGYNNGDYDSFGEFNTSAWYANQGVSGPYTAAPTESALTLTGYGQVNASGQTYVNYKWVANGGTTSTNTTGSIDTTVEVDPSGGFSVVTWTGTGGSVTLGHGLNAAPSMLICKPFTSGAALMDWTVFHKNMGTAGAFPADNSRMYLNSNGTYSVGSNLFVPSGNTSSVFEVNSNINPSSKDMVAFCFTNVEGYIAANNYTGNGSDDGTFIYMGFKPAWFMIKDTGNANNWIVYDSARETFNVMDKYLNPDTAGVEESGDLAKIDFLSNGVKMRTDHVAFNGSGRNYIYLAFAHNPFKYSLAR
jgi:hypothetical protein